MRKFAVREEKNYTPSLFKSTSHSNVADIPTLIFFFVTSVYLFACCLSLYFCLSPFSASCCTLYLFHTLSYLWIIEMYLFASLAFECSSSCCLRFWLSSKMLNNAQVFTASFVLFYLTYYLLHLSSYQFHCVFFSVLEEVLLCRVPPGAVWWCSTHSWGQRSMHRDPSTVPRGKYVVSSSSRRETTCVTPLCTGTLCRNIAGLELGYSFQKVTLNVTNLNNVSGFQLSDNRYIQKLCDILGVCFNYITKSYTISVCYFP